MSRILDLSGPLYNGMWTYNDLPGMVERLPRFAVKRVTTVADVGFESFRFVLSSISGTYIETGAHLIDGVPPLSDLDVSAFIRPAVVCHVPGKGPRELIHASELAANCPPIQEGDALLIECGWASHWRLPDYVTHGPSFHRDCLAWLMDQPLSLLGVDVPSIEPYWPGADAGEPDGNMLVRLFQKGILLLAPLVNLDSVDARRGELIALPLRVDGASGVPCRALLRLS